MNTKTIRYCGQTLAIAILGLMLTACTIREPSSLPLMPLPEKWGEPLPSPTTATTLKSDWWQDFNSVELNRLVERALKDNPDLLIAAERIRQAEIALKITDADRLPTIGLTAGSSSSWSRADNKSTTRREATNLGLSISYELDLWGKIAANVAAGEASLKATRFDYDAARLSLAASVAGIYFQSLATNERLRIAQENLESAKRILAIVEARHTNGVATRLEVSQQNTTVLSQQAALIPLSVQVRQLHSTLALLLGQIPQGASFAKEDLARLKLPTVMPELPATLITRRPDIASAEATLASNDANVAAARAALLPGASLSASGGLSSALLFDLASPTRSLSLALSLVQSIFDGGRLRLQTETARSQQAVQIITYAKVVRTALKEVDDGLSNVEKTDQQEKAQQAVLDQATRSLHLAELRYREGVGDLLSILEAERTVFTARDQLVTLRLARLQASIDLCKALGGGWDSKRS